MMQGTAADERDRRRGNGEPDIDEYPQDSESEWQSQKEFEGNNIQVDMNRMDSPDHRRDGHEGITLRVPLLTKRHNGATTPVSQVHTCQERPEPDGCDDPVIYSSDNINHAPFPSKEK
jgi:hypothetical protein